MSMRSTTCFISACLMLKSLFFHGSVELFFGGIDGAFG